MIHENADGLPWIHQLQFEPGMPWTVLKNDPERPYIVLQSAGYSQFRIFRPHAAIIVGDVIE